MSIEQPAADTALALSNSTEWEEIAELLGLDEDQAEELEDYIPDTFSMVGVVIAGDIVIDGDTTTIEIAKGHFGPSSGMAGQAAAAHDTYINAMAEEGYSGWNENFVIIVLGDVKISGTLEIVQYRPLYVLGEVHARSVLGHTGNLVAKGAIHAPELVVWNSNEEGGLIWSPTINTPLMIETDYPGGIWRLNDQGESVYEEDTTPLAEFLTGFFGETVTRSDLYFSLQNAIKSGRGGEVASEFLRAKQP